MLVGKMGSVDRSMVQILHTCLFLLLEQTVCGQLYDISSGLTPLVGNSPKNPMETVSGYLIYTCVNGAWMCGNGYATLMDETTNKVIGNYTCGVDENGEMGTWMLLNSEGDSVESGQSKSVVSRRPVVSSYSGDGGLPSQLVQAVCHENAGASSTVSHVHIYNVVGGVPPARNLCSSTVYSQTVPFNAKFCLWTQDSVPTPVPQDLSAPGRVVVGFFDQGYISYQYNGSAWVDSGRYGMLYTLPGTPAIREFWLKDSTECWDIYDPNGFTLYGERISPEVAVATNACPWSLSVITSKSTSSTFVGPFDHVQMASTRGGLVPSLSSNPASGAMSLCSFQLCTSSISPEEREWVVFYMI